MKPSTDTKNKFLLIEPGWRLGPTGPGNLYADVTAPNGTVYNMVVFEDGAKRWHYDLYSGGKMIQSSAARGSKTDSHAMKLVVKAYNRIVNPPEVQDKPAPTYHPLILVSFDLDRIKISPLNFSVWRRTVEDIITQAADRFAEFDGGGVGFGAVDIYLYGNDYDSALRAIRRINRMLILKGLTAGGRIDWRPAEDGNMQSYKVYTD